MNILKIYDLFRRGWNKLRKFTRINKKALAIIVGAFALIWFLIRVIPKPQRASYPCQRAAFPLASAFVIWIVGLFSSKLIYNKAKLAFANKRIVKTLVFGFIAVAIFLSTTMFTQIFESTAAGLKFIKLKQFGNELYENQVKLITEPIIEPKAYVGIVKSDQVDVYDIEFDELNEMVREAVNLAGGFDTLFNEGDTVVLKPNVISSRTEAGVVFPQTGNGIATDYRIIQIVANMVRERNAAGKIYIIEASGNGVTRTNIEELGYYNITGIDSIILLDEFKGEWYDTNDPDLAEVNLPEGKHLYSASNKYYLHNLYKNAQVLISLPCLKSHGLTGITGAVKNVGIGATPVQIYGNGPGFPDIVKAARWDRINHGDYITTTAPLDRWIHDFYMCRPVDYVITDGLQGAEYGPYPGGMTGANVTLKSVQKNIGIILAGKDALAVDAVHALIAGYDPYLVGHLQLLSDEKMGCINPSTIKIKGTQVHEVKTRFNEDNPGRRSQYDDFDPPWVAVPESCSIVDNQLSVTLDPAEEVVKIEVAYDDTIFNPIIVNNFESFTIPLANYQTDISKVQVLAYDKFLNCHKFTPDRLILSSHESHINELKIYPVPATDYLNVDYSELDGNVLIEIVSTKGEIIIRQASARNKKISRIDISILPNGNYIVIASSTTKQLSSKFIKQ